MTRGVRLYLVGSFVLVSLAGCGRGFFQSAEREPWRREAELSCLKSGSIKEGTGLVRIDPISGPGICGAEFPLKVAELGEIGGSIGFADDLRPPAAIGRNQPRWPVQPAAAPSEYPPVRSPQYPEAQSSPYPQVQSSPYPDRAARGQAYPQQGNGPVSLRAPGVAEPEYEDADPAFDDAAPPPRGRTPAYGSQPYQSNGRSSTQQYPQPPASQLPNAPLPNSPLPRLGPAQGNQVATIGPVTIKPSATLACPIVSALDRWIMEAVQPAAMRWLGAQVVEIKQISAYSCRGMNGNSRSQISEHAFGNALDISAFTLADGRRVSVKDGWRGLPEEQGFLRDIQGAACQRFNTVLAPGSNIYHYDHIHVDLMRRGSGRVICQPAAVSGEQIAGRASPRNSYANGEPGITGSIAQGGRRVWSRRALSKEDRDTIEDESRISDSSR